MTKPKAKTRAELQYEVVELKAQLACTYHYADSQIHKAGPDALMGSGALLRLHAIGGRPLIDPVMILNGLSPETIKALRADIQRSFALATRFKPKT